ncbi:MAG TPA: hypothetical protein VGX68_17590 [Thermoanaerobaculia bacterium]|jgi:hypothetical protein|nr:hypothetical protein [Thermoanaerobaculia bacterium]
MKQHRLLLLILALVMPIIAIAPRSTVAAPADCATQCQRDYERCSARGLDSIACMSRYETCLASC